LKKNNRYDSIDTGLDFITKEKEMFDQEKYKNVDINGIETNINGKSPEKIAEYINKLKRDNERLLAEQNDYIAQILTKN
jgi:hypothetical protein